MENCSKYQERISAFVDGMLTEEERLELMEHMAACPGCRSYFDDQIVIHDALTALEADAPKGFAESVMARVRETKQDAPERRAAFPYWKRWAATAACCALAALGILSLQNGGESERWSLLEQNLTPATAPQDAAGYGLRTQEGAYDSDEAAAGDAAVTFAAAQADEPSAQAETAPAEGIAACSLEEDAGLYDQTAASPAVEDMARMNDANSKEAAAVSCTITTASPLARQWLADLSPDTASSPQGYHLTEEQFSQLRQLLEEAGEPFSCAEAPSDGGPCWYLILILD